MCSSAWIHLMFCFSQICDIVSLIGSTGATAYGPYLSQFTDRIHWVCLGPQWWVYWREPTVTPVRVHHKTYQWIPLDPWCNSLVWFDTYVAISQMIHSTILPPLGRCPIKSPIPSTGVHWHKLANSKGCAQSFCVVKWAVECLFKLVVSCSEVLPDLWHDFLDLLDGRCVVTYPQSHRKWAQLTAHHESSIWQPLAVKYPIYYSQHSAGLIHCL